MFGCHGNILHVDLSKQTLSVEHPDEAFYRQYMGGSALGMFYILKNTPVGIDAFDPANTLAFTLSVLTGAPFSGQSRLSVSAKSPLTGAIGDSQGGGFFPAELKFAGFDALIIQGRAERPVYLWLHDGQAELREAGHLWGKDTGQVEQSLRAELGDEKVQVLQCGPAGEKRVRFAAILSMRTRANGRTGMGAVMGSKNLKAVAVRGRAKPAIVDKQALRQIARWGVDHFKEANVFGLGLYGTAGSVGWQNEAGGLPTTNWSSGTFAEWEALSGQRMAQTILKARDTCYACTVRCKRVVAVDQADYQVDPQYGGPEYETVATFGSYCGISDLNAVAYANQLCNQYGMDSISCGATIAWAMDCVEHGILTANDLDGLDLRFGNAQAMVEMVEKIARREGAGDLLAEGSARAAQVVGGGALDLVVAVKKQELPAHMPQVKHSVGLIYAVNPFGADHQSHEHDPSYRAFPERMAEIGLTEPQPNRVLNEQKVRFALTTQYVYSCMDSLNVCQFVFGPAWQLYSIGDLVKATRAVTGWDVQVEDLLQLGRMRLNMLRAFNAREGIGRQDDTLPKKLFQPLAGGASDGFVMDAQALEQAQETYYRMAGWDVASGMPLPETLQTLGLGWIKL